MELQQSDESTSNTFEMKISMSVLEALGINLYSNAAAVLSELVANAWDADAGLVRISWGSAADSDPIIEIEDDGSGMTREQLNRRFLTVGYSKRTSEGGQSAGLGRPFMGRKGIGKLSVFSIANVVEVHSARDGERNALRIDVDDLKERISIDKPYHPDAIEPIDRLGEHGTIIRLSSLRRKRIDIALTGLRKRVARRFDILTLVAPPPEEQRSQVDQILHQFEGLRIESKVEELRELFYVALNGDVIDFSDRVELGKLEYIWEFGKEQIPARSLASDVGRVVIGDSIPRHSQWKVTGWFGTVKRPDELIEDTEAGSLKNIIILSRGRPIQEGIIERLDFSRVFVSYLTGQIRADFLDEDDADDIATSDRQRLMEDDPRVEALRNFIREAVLKASDQWSEWRPTKKAKEVIAKNSAIQGWINSLPHYQQGPATKLMGTIESLSIPESTDAQKDKRRLFQSGIVAFARIGLREDLERLNLLTSLQGEDVLRALGTLEGYESALYLDLIRARIETVESFSSEVEENVLERVLQERLHASLWLLDPAWDRISQDVSMEERVFEMAETLGAARPDEDALKRIDLRYCNVQNRHVIIELKRPKVKPDIDVLYDQGLAYVNALRRILEETGRGDEPYEVIFVVGDKPSAKKTPPGKNVEDYSRDRVAEINGRVFRYRELIHRARAQYSHYIEANKSVSKLNEVLDALSDKPQGV